MKEEVNLMLITIKKRTGFSGNRKEDLKSELQKQMISKTEKMSNAV